MTEDASDGTLVDRYRQGDAEALAALVEKYRRPLFAYVLNMTEGREDVDEIFQEVWFRVIRRIGRYRQRSFYGWIVRIAHNLVIDRARRRRPSVPLDADADPDGYAPAETLPAAAADPAAVSADADLGRRIARAVRELPPEQREVFVLRTHGGLSFKEVAAVQRVSINTALARMQYALGKLRLMLQEDYEQLDR